MRFRVFAHVVFAAATMASELLGAFREFDPSAETFTVYAERLDQFFVANKIGIVPIDASAGRLTILQSFVICAGRCPSGFDPLRGFGPPQQN